MDINQTNSDLIKFWDSHFQDIKPMTIVKEDVKVENELDQYLKKLGDTCETIIDVGCGLGFSLMTAKLLGKKMVNGYGFDTSEKGIEFAKETVKLSKISDLEFVTENHHYLDRFDDQSVDGIFCSNFLDVIPRKTSQEVIDSMIRIVKPLGYVLLKLNFYLDEDLIKKLNMEVIDQDTYAINGILRAHNLTTEAWIDRFKGFKLVSTGEYQRAPKMPYDRIILLQKKGQIKKGGCQ
ncbi:MAG: class I SAM-dependent methyltransferase [Acholeplasmataceae bacterium]